jgi:hypothetical protein
MTTVMVTTTARVTMMVTTTEMASTTIMVTTTTIMVTTTTTMVTDLRCEGRQGVRMAILAPRVWGYRPPGAWAAFARGLSGGGPSFPRCDALPV